MKQQLIVLLIITLFLQACEEEAIALGKLEQSRDTIPTIVMEGNKSDTAYLYASYTDPGASVYLDLDGKPSCSDLIPVSEITGSVNTRLPGTYFIKYDAKDVAGKPLSTATRTVHVIKNNAGFLNGNYNVTCTCTAVTRGLPDPVITTNAYVATVASGSQNNYFKITMLKIGPEYLDATPSLNGEFIDIEAGYFSPDYHINSSGAGTVSAAKNNFTIETKFYQYSPSTTHLCKNIYTKQLIIN